MTDRKASSKRAAAPSSIESDSLRPKYLEQTVLDAARERIAYAFDKFDHVAVAFSGGKDSTDVLNLSFEEAARRGRLPLDCFFFDEEAVPPPTVDYVRRVSQRPGISLRWYCLPVEHRNACSRTEPYWHPWDPAERHRWVRELPPEAITQRPGFNGESIPVAMGLLFHPDQGTVGVLLGIRADESLRRRRALSCRVTENWITPFKSHHTVKSDKRVLKWNQDYISLCKPIYDWTTPDVWTAVRKFGWDYNHTYDLYAAAGMPAHQQRVCPPFGEEPLQNLWTYAICFPETWERMIYRVEGAATAARYARSPLYAFREMPREPPGGGTWGEAIHAVLELWPEDIARKVAERIRVEIVRHNRSTNSATIPDFGDFGCSWSYLYMLAVRGDFKGRRKVKLPIGADVKV